MDDGERERKRVLEWMLGVEERRDEKYKLYCIM